MSDKNNSDIAKNATEIAEIAAISALSTIEKKDFNLIASSLFGTTNFKGANLVSNLPPTDSELIAFIENQIRDGLHISFLEEGEKLLLSRFRGEKWYEFYGFVSPNEAI